MRRVLRTAAFAALVAVGTTLGGWWTVPLLAALWVRVLPRSGVRSCLLGAALGWALLLGGTAVDGPVGLVAQRAGGVFQVPAWGFVLVTLLFPALLAGAAARAARPPRHPR